MKTAQMKGFTLIEMLITIVILAILAAIAYPSYIEFLKRGHGVDVRSHLEQLAAQIENRKVSSGSYSGISLAGIDSNNAGKWPKSGKQLYTVTLSPATLGSHEWELKAAPLSSGIMSGNGNIKLNHQGQKCWTEGGDCSLTSSSSW